MTPNEIHDLLSERDIYDKEIALLQAFNNAMLVMNDKANDNYKNLEKDIRPSDHNNNSSDTYKRYYNISKRLGLKMPKELENKYSKSNLSKIEKSIIKKDTGF